METGHGEMWQAWEMPPQQNATPLLTCLVTLNGSSNDNPRWGLGAEINT